MEFTGICESVSCETLSVELKEFFIRAERRLSPERYEELILSGSMYSNDLILRSLRIYIQKYIPKYISGWNNEDLDLNEGDLYFGVKDDGTIVGIPFDGELNELIIREMILSTEKLINCEGKMELLESIGIDIIPIVPCEVNMMEEYEREIDKYEEQQRLHKEKVKEYIAWHKNTLHWHCKVINVLNDIPKRERFINWLERHCNVDTKREIIDEVINWEVKESFDFMVTDVKNNRRGMIYWLCLFKDIIMAGRGPKPIIPAVKEPRWDKFYLCPYKMNYYIGEMNPDINFYLVRLRIPNRRKTVFAMNKGEWTQYIRVENELGPSSVPVNEADKY